MDSVILFAVVMLIVACGLIGRHIGFVKMILSMAATVVALIIAGVLTPPICQVVKDNLGILDDIKVKVEESIKDAGIEEDYIDELKIPSVIKDKIKENILNMCYKEKKGIFENYDSITGKGLYCGHFSWSCVFLIEFILNFNKNCFN